jgi:hypothetical protein
MDVGECVIHVTIYRRQDGTVTFTIRYEKQIPTEEHRHKALRAITDYCVRNNLHIIEHREQTNVTLEHYLLKPDGE